MLINSVILFLRDALPIFVLLVYLYAHLPTSKLWLLACCVVGAILSVIYISQIHTIGQWIDGKGIELFLFLSQLFVYALSLFLGYGLIRHYRPNNADLFWIAGLMICLTLVSKGSNFILYFEGYLNQSKLLQAILLGTFLGLGICSSLAILLYLAAQSLKQRFGPWATWTLIHIYVTGQLVNALPLLVQVDLIDASTTAWNSRHLINDEFGHLFKVLFGYQATPSIAQVTLYILALVIPLATFCWLKLNSASHSGNTQ